MEIEWNIGAKIGIHECAYEDLKFYKKLRSLNELLKDSTYDFSKAKYQNENTPLTIICKEHGEFEATPKELRSKKFKGCIECQNYVFYNIKYDQETFIEKCTKENSERFDYSNVTFEGFDKPIYPRCKEHGRIKVNNPATHLSYTTCPKCRGSKTRYTKEQFVEKAIKLHGDLYNYEKSDYISSRDPIEIYCNYCKNYFILNQASTHLQGTGCNLCCNGGFDSSKPGILYYLSINNGEAYKIGITNRTVKERYSSNDYRKIKIIKTWKYEFGNDARLREQEILNTFKYAKYEGTSLLESCTNKEIFSYDVLLLDTPTNTKIK